MKRKIPTTPLELVPARELTETDMVRGATNHPSLASDSVMLGDREFKILDLEYDPYVRFLAYLQPLMEVILSRVSAMQGVVLPKESGISAASLVTYCAESLPEMARIVCQSTDPAITVEEVKRLGKNPFKLASVVLAQVNQNKMIKDFSDFFQLVLPLMKQK